MDRLCEIMGLVLQGSHYTYIYIYMHTCVLSFEGTMFSLNGKPPIVVRHLYSFAFPIVLRGPSSNKTGPTPWEIDGV